MGTLYVKEHLSYNNHFSFIHAWVHFILKSLGTEDCSEAEAPHLSLKRQAEGKVFLRAQDLII